MKIEKQLTTHSCDYMLTVIIDKTSLTVVAEDMLNYRRWTGELSAQYVEELTHKTGNFKRFEVFSNMLVSALKDRSSSVSVDLLSYNQLEMLKSRRKATVSSDAEKRYLILTYIGEFDKVHYPIPLSYEDITDPEELRGLVVKLRREVEMFKRGLPKDRQDQFHLYQENADLREQLTHTKRQIASGQVDELKRALLEMEDQLEFSKKEHNKEIQELKNQKSEAEARLQEYSQKLETILKTAEEEKPIHDRNAVLAKETERLFTDLRSTRDENVQRKRELEAVKNELKRTKENEKRLKIRVETLEKELQAVLQTKPNSDFSRSRSFSSENPFKGSPIKSPDKPEKLSPDFKSPSQTSKYAKSLLKKFAHKDGRTSMDASGRIDEHIKKVQMVLSASRV